MTGHGRATRWSDTIFPWNHFSKEFQKDFLGRKIFDRSNIRIMMAMMAMIRMMTFMVMMMKMMMMIWSD